MISKQFSLLAFPASHSFSPAMHNAGFQFIQSTYRYGRLEIAPENLSDFFQNDVFRFAGLSVSVPHKETCIRFLQHLDPAAKSIGAVNTIINQNGVLTGYNTDHSGFIKSLTQYFNPFEKTVLVLGAGGAARAIVYALLNAGAKKIILWNRTPEKAKTLALEFNIDWTDDVFLVQKEVDLVVNTTSLGMAGKHENQSPIARHFWKTHHTAYDVVYTPVETLFLQDASYAGANAISGERMLSFQAQEQFLLFTGQNIPVEILEFGMLLAKRNFANWTPHVFTENEKQSILGTIVTNKISELFLSFEAEIDVPKHNNPHRFLHALQQSANTPHIIAEIKPASPSKGKLIAQDETVESIAMQYEKAGATAISVITDYVFFGGLVQNISRVRSVSNLPILRKDFIIQESQIAEAAQAGADAVLLMRSVLPAFRLQQLLEYAEGLGLDALVETHTEEELFSVLNQTTAKIIGINARDLHTLAINPWQFSQMQELVKNHPRFSEIIWVAESGISSKEDIETYAKNANALLIGSVLMTSKNKEKTLQSFRTLGEVEMKK